MALLIGDFVRSSFDTLTEYFRYESIYYSCLFHNAAFRGQIWHCQAQVICRGPATRVTLRYAVFWRIRRLLNASRAGRSFRADLAATLSGGFSKPASISRFYRRRK